MSKNLFLEAAKIEDINKLAQFCTKNFANDYTLLDFLEDANNYCPEKFSDMYSSTGSVLLRDSEVNDQDAYSYLYNIMETLHYDNGEPLISDDNNYFDHYDRSQEFWGYFNDMDISDFITDGKELYIRVDMTPELLKDMLKDEYDGASYEHDFGER